MNSINTAESIVELIERLKFEGIPEGDYYIYVNRFLERKARNKCIPLTGNFELTPFCNLDCKMCYVHLDNSQYNRKDLLPPSVWKEMIQQAYNAGMRIATLTGGECLTYPGFNDVYLCLYSMGIKPGVLSNGILIDEERLDFFKKYPPRMVQVSLYGSSEEAYERVTGHRCFERVYRNLCLLRDSNIAIKITITPSLFIEDDIRSFLQFVENLHIPYNINANLIPPRSNTGRLTYDLPVDKYVEIFKTRFDLNSRMLTEIDPTELPSENHSSNPHYGLLCGAGRSSFGIKYDGSMCPCLSLPDINAYPLTSGFVDAWKEINNQIIKWPMPMECGDCVYLDRCLPCIAMHGNAPQKGHCDPRICERTKKLVAAGFISKP